MTSLSGSETNIGGELPSLVEPVLEVSPVVPLLAESVPSVGSTVVESPLLLLLLLLLSLSPALPEFVPVALAVPVVLVVVASVAVNDPLAPLSLSPLLSSPQDARMRANVEHQAILHIMEDIIMIQSLAAPL